MATTSESSSHVSSAGWSASMEVPVLCVGNALGSCGTLAQPIWVAALIRNGQLTPSEIGWLASSELLCIGIATLATSVLGRQARPRTTAITAAVLVGFANVIAIIPGTATFILGRLLSGIGMGTLLATTFGVAARRPDAQGVIALMQLAVLFFAGMLYFASPTLTEAYGPAGPFVLIAGVAGAVAATARYGLSNGTVRERIDTIVSGPVTAAPLLGSIAAMSVAAGMTTMGTYLVTIGYGLGFTPHAVGNLLSLAVPLAMLGPATARILGERWGLLWPILLGLSAMVVDFFLIVSAGAVALFGLYTALLFILGYFYVSYAITLIGRLDSSGRFASAVPAFIMLGGAAGPRLGSELADFAHSRTLATLAASCVGVGIVLFVASQRASKQPAPVHE